MHTHSIDWFDRILDETKSFDLVMSRDGEGPDELIYTQGAATRLNDATFVNTGVLLFRRSDGWSTKMLKDWWNKGDEQSEYLFGRTYDQVYFLSESPSIPIV